MKTSLRTLLLCSLLLPAALFAAPFEGKVSLKMSSDGKAHDIRYNIKGDKLRIDMPAASGGKSMGGMIVDLGKKETTMLMDEQKMYMTMAMPDNTAPKASGKNEDVKLEKTSQTEKILGYLATKYLATSKDSTTEMWLAEGIGMFTSLSGSNPMGGRKAAAPQGWESSLAGKELFPLRVVTKNKGGKETFRMEATAVDKQSLPDTLFAPPADYQKLDMSGMMKGLLPGTSR
ncbi:MAG: DUF4412 domain-containing protein [Verrucomicrobiota bacterium]